MAFPISGLTELTQNLPGNYVNVNDVATAAENMNHAVFEIDVALGGTITVTAVDDRKGGMFKFTGAPAGAFTVDFPDGDRKRAFWNESGQTATIDTVTGSTTTVTVVTTAQKELRFDGVEIVSELTLTKV